MQGDKNLSNLPGFPLCDSDIEEDIEGSTPQPSQQNQQASSSPSQQPTVSTRQEGPMRVCRVCHDDEEMRLDVTMMKRDISRITDKLETQGQKLQEVWGVCESTHENIEYYIESGAERMDCDISCMTDELETQSHKLEEVLGVCEVTHGSIEYYLESDVARMKDDISSITEELETQRKKLEEVGKVCEKTHESVENILKELQKQQNSRTESATGRKRSKEKQKVDPLCRDTFRKMYRSLEKKDNFQGFNFKVSFDSAENEEVFRRVKEKMSGNNGSSKWTDEGIKLVGRRYFLSLYETDKKKSDNKYDDHKTNSRRQNRKKQKLNRRTEALDKIDWVRREKGKAAEVLTEEYMSSEVSESGEESLSGDEGCSKEKKLYIKTVPWESEDLKTLKSKLDVEYASRQTSRSRRREFQRDRRLEDVSSRPKPKNGPSWAFKKDDGQ